MKSYEEILAEIDALPRIVLPHSIEPRDVPGSHRSYTSKNLNGDLVRVYGFASEATRNEAAKAFGLHVTIPADDVTPQ